MNRRRPGVLRRSRRAGRRVIPPAGLALGLLCGLVTASLAAGEQPPAAGERPEAPAVSGPYWGLWNWAEGSRSTPLLLHAVQAARSDSIYRTLVPPQAVTPPDTLQHAFFLPERWSLGKSRAVIKERNEFDVSTGELTRARVLSGRPLGEPIVFTPERFGRSQIVRAYRTEWVDTTGRLVAAAAVGSEAKPGLLNLKLPAMPPALRSIFGEGNSSLSVSGSEKISFSGTSRWFPYKKTNVLSGQSKFPDLDMKQELFLKLQGTVGDKVHVDIDQNSSAQTSLENQIRIRYEGYEDDVVQRINLGNTSLSLPGTKYVSYGGRHEGLFGISAEAQLGAIKVTTIASKQESEATTRSVPSRNAASSPIPDIKARDYVRRKFFFLDDPNRVRFARFTDILTGESIDGPGIAPVEIDAANIKLYKDDRNPTNDTVQGAFPAYVTPTGYPPCACPDAPFPCDSTFATLEQYETYDVYDLTPDVDYIVHPDQQSFEFKGTVIELLQPLADDEVLCASFRTTSSDPVRSDVFDDGIFPDVIGTPEGGGQNTCAGVPAYRMIGPPLEVLSGIDTLSTGPWSLAHRLECRNFYRLGGRNIADLDLEILWDRTGSFTNPNNYRNVPYLEITGLDTERLVGTTPQPGQDREVDGKYVDLTQGILHFPQLRPFAPDSFDVLYRRSPLGVRGVVREGWPGDEFQLVGADPDSGNYPEPEIYDLKATVYHFPSDPHLNRDRFIVRGQFESPINTIELNAFNIIDGSEVVTAGNRELIRGQDYDIDYEFGVVTIKESANVRPDEEVNVTFSFAPVFGTASRTLVGMSSSLRPEGGNYGFSSTWLFDSKGNPERRVRLGEEPTRTIVGEFSGDYKTESTLLTDVLGRLPFYTPATRSQLSMAGALGLSIPNPNTKGEAYIDDFDAAREPRELNLNYRSWMYPAIPRRILDEVAPMVPADSLTARAAALRGNLIWYAPRRAALREDLNPELGSEEGDDAVRVLESWLEPNPVTPGVPDSLQWFGLTQAISNSGEDFSTAQFLEVWINDYGNDPRWGGHLRENGSLYIDIGEISEDAVWWRTGPEGWTPADSLELGFGYLDTEDRNRDGRLDECIDLDPACNEDTGLDGVFDGEGDQHRDDWDFPDDRSDEEDDPSENRETFRSVNGTELNSSLDGEDLNSDLRLNQQNNYFTYRFDLASTDTAIVVTDVVRDYTGVDPTNSWRLIRIPLGPDFEFSRTGSPDYTQVRHLRIWFAGREGRAITEPVPLQIASVEFIGNRWLSGGDLAPIRDETGNPVSEDDLLPGQKFAVSVVNNKDNGDIYEPAFELQRDRQGQGDEFEGYLSMDLLNFPAGHSGSCYRRFPQDQDYTLYESIEFYTQIGRPEAAPIDLEFFIRFGSADGKNYYEYRRAVRTGAWEFIHLPVKDLSNLKQNLPADQQFIKEPTDDGRAWLVMRGRPSFTRVRQIELGVRNTSGGTVRSASVWVNELRLDDVQRNVATASQFQLSAKLSDLGSFNFDWRGREADFLGVGQSRGTGVNDRNLGYQATLNADRFVPRLQMRLPVSYSFTSGVREPKFQTGNDVVFEGENQDLNITRALNESFRISYDRTPSQSPFLRYTIDGFNASYSLDRNRNQSPTSTDTTTTWAANVNYSFTTPRHRLIPLPFGMGLDYLPNQFAAGTAFRRSTRATWQRPSADLTQPLEFQNEAVTRSSALNWNTSYRMLLNPNVNYTFASTRDLLQNGKEVAGLDLGVETNRSESLSAAYTLSVIHEETARKYPLGRQVAAVVNKFLAPLGPSVNWSGRFSSGIDYSRVTAQLEFSPQAVDNSAKTTARASLPVSSILRAIRNMARKQPGPQAPEPRPAPDEKLEPEREEERPKPEDERLVPPPELEPEGSGGEIPDPGMFAPPGIERERPLPEGAADEPPPPPGEDEEKEGESEGQSEQPEPDQPGRKTGGGARGKTPPPGQAAPAPQAAPRSSAFGLSLIVQDITGQISQSRGSNYSYVDGMPSFLYQLALTRDLGGSVRRLATNNTTFTNVDGFNLASGLRLSQIRIGSARLGTSLDVKATYNHDETVSERTALGSDLTPSPPTLSISERTDWPDLQFTASGVQEGIGFLEARFRRISLTSRYQKSNDVSGDHDEPRRREQVSTDWSPLISMEATMKSGMRLTLRTTRREIETANNGTNQTLSTNRTSGISFTLQHTLERKRRISVPLGGAQRLITTRIDFSVNVSIDRNRDTTRSAAQGFLEVESVNRRVLSVSTDVGYNFTRNIHGTAKLTYGETKDYKTISATSRTMGVTIAATFQF